MVCFPVRKQNETLRKKSYQIRKIFFLPKVHESPCFFALRKQIFPVGKFFPPHFPFLLASIREPARTKKKPKSPFFPVIRNIACATVATDSRLQLQRKFPREMYRKYGKMKGYGKNIGICDNLRKTRQPIKKIR